MPTPFRKLFSILLIVVLAGPAGAQDLSGDDVRSLDGQVQAIKSDVLSIAAELNTLEERLLFPSNTQLAVFVSIDDSKPFRLDAVELRIDGELAMHHIYSYKELEALQKGGVQRVYTGNVPLGGHQIDVTMAGKLDNGDDFEASGSYTFDKGIKPAALGVTLASPALDKDGVRIGAW